MTEPFRFGAAWAGALVIGLGLSTGSMLAFAPAAIAPALWMSQPTRRRAFTVGAVYYAFGLHPMVPAVEHFFGRRENLLDGVYLWLAASALLASVWAILWSQHKLSLLWRIPAALFLTVVPPVGLIGWISPLTGAGVLFPNTSFVGIVAVALLPAVLLLRPHIAALIAVVATLNSNSVYSPPDAIHGWEAHDTHIDSSSQDLRAQFANALEIQSRALQSNARVIIFPETVILQWNQATDTFWEDTLSVLQHRGQTLLVGATVPIPHPTSRFDFSGSLAALQQQSSSVRSFGPTPDPSSRIEPYRNAVLIRGVETGLFDQRVPVPLGMWRPLARTPTGVPLNIAGSGVVEIAGQRAAMLVCYEQLISWPILASIFEKPSVIVGIANNHWVAHTSIPSAQKSTVHAWARLFGLPVLFATNR